MLYLSVSQVTRRSLRCRKVRQYTLGPGEKDAAAGPARAGPGCDEPPNNLKVRAGALAARPAPGRLGMRRQPGPRWH